ncbi:MAG TPA: zinc ribbon domain-containing protein [Polyangia bacterium]|jgi:hypothetical protein|nr:zinc ribbon domain-containing protein [Polyangia bacterium]
MTSSATLTKSSGTLGGSSNPPATRSGEQSSPDAQAIDADAEAPSEPAPRKRLPLWLLALSGALLAAGYAVLIEKMRLGPPLVMFALGGMTLALTAAAFIRVVDPLAGNSGSGASAPVRGRRRTRELEREKQLVLKAIKEVELDYQMRKIAERDYREMVERYRTRAMRLMSELDAGDDYRTLIERELAMRLKLEVGKPAPGAAPTPRACPACSTVNDEDAQFCKKCGVKLSAA